MICGWRFQIFEDRFVTEVGEKKLLIHPEPYNFQPGSKLVAKRVNDKRRLFSDQCTGKTLGEDLSAIAALTRYRKTMIFVLSYCSRLIHVLPELETIQ